MHCPYIMHYYKLIVSKPIEIISCEKFNLKNKGEQISFHLNFQTAAIYDLVMHDLDEKIPGDYNFTGEIRLDIYHKEKIIHSEIIKKEISKTYIKNSISYYKTITLYRLEIPFKRKKNDLMIKITVVEPDKELSEYRDRLQLCIKDSAMI